MFISRLSLTLRTCRVHPQRPVLLCATQLLLLASGLGAACGGDGAASRAAETTSAKAQAPSMSQAVTDLAAPGDGAERSRQLVHIAAAVVGNYEPIDGERSGTLEKGRAQDHMLLLRYGRCYRIIGVANTGIVDLDLALFDGDQVERLRDLSSDRYPALGLTPSLCPERTQAYRLEVRAAQGAGDYTVGVWQSPL